MTGTAPLDDNDLANRLRIEFRDDAQDRLDQIYLAIDRFREGVADDAGLLVVVAREASKLRGIGASCGFPLVNLIAQRLEGYLSGLRTVDQREVTDILAFTDRLARAVEGEERPDVAATNQIIRALPVRYEFDITDIEVRDVEIMLVTPSKVVAKLLATEMNACGFATNLVHDPIEAMGLAVRMPPDMVIASAVMDGLGGLDLIRGLKAMSVTAHIPMALLTSLDTTLRDVPRDVAVIRVGNHFGEDFAAAITRFDLG